MMIRICDARDAACPNGMSCQEPCAFDRAALPRSYPMTDAPKPAAPAGTQLRPREELLALIDGLVSETMALPLDWTVPRWLSPLSEAAERIRADAHPPAPIAGMAEELATVLRETHSALAAWTTAQGAMPYKRRALDMLAKYEAAARGAPRAAEVSAGDMAAFGASEHACILYPGEDQVPERAAFCAGAAALAAPPSASGAGEADLTAIAERMRASYAEPEQDGRTNRAVVRAFDLLLEQFRFATQAGGGGE